MNHLLLLSLPVLACALLPLPPPPEGGYHDLVVCVCGEATSVGTSVLPPDELAEALLLSCPVCVVHL